MMIEKLKQILKLNTKKLKSIDEQISEMFDSLGEDDLCLRIGEDLTQFGEDFCGNISDLRRKIKDQTGFIMPAVRILDCSEYQENEYRIFVRNKCVLTEFTVPTKDYACNEIINAMEKCIFEHIEDVFTNEITEKYVDHVQRRNSWLVYYLSRLIPTTGIKLILINLLKNGKSIKDITYIFEKICEQATKEKDMCTMRDPEKIAKILANELK